jgi:hypothetical protein
MTARGRRPVWRTRGAALLCCALALGALGPPLAGGGRLLARASAAEDWRAEFEDVCSKTQDAMALSSDELRALVARCDALKPKVEALDPSQRKVYERRLQLCRELYTFVLGSREK